MTRHALGRRLLVNGLAVFLSTVAIGAPPAVQNPWTKVPALPTGCYAEQDGFAKTIGPALEAMSVEIDRQEQTNREVSNSLDNMDDAEKQSRMQSFLMKNLQEAMKMMQETQAVGAMAQEAVPKGEENRQKLEGQHKDLLARYDAALDKAVGPLFAKKRTLPDGEGTPEWAVAEWRSLNKKANAEYERLCGEWWRESGPFHAWLKSDRGYLEEDLPWKEKLEDELKAQLALLGIPTASYRSTVTLNAVREYM